MSQNGPDEIKTIVEKMGRRVSESGEIKKIVSIDSVDEEGTVHKTTEVEKGMNDCGHVGEVGAVCAFCGGFTCCSECARSGKFACASCGRSCCPGCSVTSLFHPDVRFCRNCGFRGLLREALKKRR